MADQKNATTTEQEEINLYTWDDVSFVGCCVIFCCVLPNTILCVAQVMDICDKMAEIIAAKDEEVVELEKTVAEQVLVGEDQRWCRYHNRLWHTSSNRCWIGGSSYCQLCHM